MSESVEQARRALWVAYGDAGHQGHWDQLADALIAAAKREAYETGYGNGESSRSADYMAALNEADLIPDSCEASPIDVIRLWRESLAAAKREATVGWVTHATMVSQIEAACAAAKREGVERALRWAWWDNLPYGRDWAWDSYRNRALNALTEQP